MQDRPLNVLMADDSPEDVELVLRELVRAGLEVSHRRVDTPEEFSEVVRVGDWDVVLADYTMPRFSAMQALAILRQLRQDVPLIVVTGTINEETAVACLKRGADDYILKDNLARLAPAIRQAIRVYEERRERQQLEEQLRHAQRMEMMGTLAGGIAHDFNNLLTAIFGHLEMTWSVLGEETVAAPHLEVIGNAAQQAVGITRALLTFSCRVPAEKKLTSLQTLCRETAKVIGRLLPATITQEWETAGEEVRILADATQIQQVLSNLLVNARDAMPRGGTVRVRAEPRVLTEEDLFGRQEASPGPYVCLEVSDTGVGMTPDVRQRVFEPFFTTKDRGQGTGLGLAIVHGIVQDHGGWIEVESERGAGTTVTVWLPSATGESPRDLPASDEDLSAPPETGVLVLEDNDIVRGLMVGALRQAGYVVSEARDGTEALAAFNAAKDAIKVVVADLEVPGMTGIDFLQRVREQSPHVAGLVVTGRVDESEPLEQADRAAVPILLKPFQTRDLLRAVRQLAIKRVRATSHG